MLAVRWKDKTCTTVLSNFGTIEPFVCDKRYDRNENKYVMIKVPNVVEQYNQFMNGVNVHNDAMANYRIGIRSKKWWWTLFTDLLDSIMINAWKLHTLIAKAEKKNEMSQIDFRINVTTILLSCGKTTSTEVNENVVSTNSMLNINLAVHCAEHIPGNKRWRCKVCHVASRYMCNKCNVALHINCFDKYSEHQ